MMPLVCNGDTCQGCLTIYGVNDAANVTKELMEIHPLINTALHSNQSKVYDSESSCSQLTTTSEGVRFNVIIGYLLF